MGKNMQHSNSTIPIPNNSPGCVWGVLHILKYHHWSYIKKRIPYRRPVNGKSAMGVGNHGSSGDDSLTVDEKMTQSSPGTKSSVRTRLKSLISEELYRMKGRHGRATSCPIQSPLMQTDSTHQLKPSDQDSPAAKNLNDGSSIISDNNFSAPSLQDPSEPNSSEDESSEDCGTKLTGKQLMSSQGNSENASTCQSKEILNALDIINMNKEFFMKFLQDPGSPFAHHFHSQQALSSKMAYSKSLSFSSSRSSKLKPKKEITESDAVEPKSKEYSRSHSMPSIPAEYQISHRKKNNQAVLKRFKNLKDKIKHVIRQTKNEKHRIAMDGILHKVPHGKELPKDLKCENLDNDSPSSCESHYSFFSTNKTPSRCFSRTSSISESLDRYCQLYESSCKGEVKHNCYEPLKLKTEDSPQRSVSKSMRRLFSSPDLKSCFCYFEDSSDAFPSSQVRIPADATMSTISDLSEQSDVKTDTISVDGDQQGKKTDSNIEENANFDLVSDDLEASQDPEEPEDNNVPVPDTSPASLSSAEDFTEEDLKLTISLPFPDEIDGLEEEQAETIMKEIPIVAESGIQKIEIPGKHIQFQVGAKDQAEFDYVKDILELSGFSKNEFLGTWHSDDQPMDPSLFEEVAGCMFLDPDQCSGNEEGYPCYNILLFDLINEVLMEIYARSYTYCPKHLSTLSHIRPMPVGHHVLEEVWTNISCYLGSTPEPDQLLDYIVSRDLAKCDGWMNLQFDCECVGIEVEDIIFYDLLEEVICS